MKVLLINGSPNKDGVLTVLKEIVATFEENDVKGEILWLSKKAMHDCTVCYKCMENGQCIYGLVNEVAVCMDESAGVIVGLSVYYGRPNGRITSFFKCLMLIIDKTKINGKLAASVASCRRGASSAFERLNTNFIYYYFFQVM